MSEDLKRNRLLACLSAGERQRLAEHGLRIELRGGQILHEELFHHAYFPTSGMISSEIMMPDGLPVPMIAAGREGGIGCAVEQPWNHVPVRSVVRLAGEAWRVPSSVWQNLTAQGQPRALREAYHDLCLAETQQTAACHLLHDVESRLCRWLLHIHDRMRGDVIPMTHAELADLASIRRTTVTLIVGSLEAADIIANRRGAIEVSDRFALEAAACECYSAIRQLHDAFDRRFAIEPASERSGVLQH